MAGWSHRRSRALSRSGRVALAMGLLTSSLGASIVSSTSGPTAAAAATAGSTIYALSTGKSASSVIPIEATTGKRGSPISLVSQYAAIAIAPDGKTAYVGDATGATVTPIATATNTPGKAIPLGYSANGLAITPDGKTAYVLNDFSIKDFHKFTKIVTPITLATNKPGKRITLPDFPTDIVITPDGKTAYVVDGSGAVSPITTATNKLGKPIQVGGRAGSLAMAPDGKTLYVGNIANGKEWLTPVATATNVAGTRVVLGAGIYDLLPPPDEAPVAGLSVVPAAVGSGLATQFSAVGSVAPTSPIVSYQWDFGDGATATTTVPTTSHVYASASTYTATVTETDAVGTSTKQVFTGQTMSRNGGPSAVATANVVIVNCTSNQTCHGTVSAAKSSSTPKQSIDASGTPTDPTGTLQVAVAPAALVCPNVDPAVAPVVDLTNTGFATTSSLTITTTLEKTTRPSSHQVCYSSEVAFKSQSSPTVAQPGTALLLNCADVANVAPCLVSTIQVGPNVVVTFLIPGGDPRFHVAQPAPARIALPVVPTGALKKAFTTQLKTTGGTGPFAWKVAKGKLPPGLNLNASTGAISGKPTKKGRSTLTVQATDSESPPVAPKMTISITIK